MESCNRLKTAFKQGRQSMGLWQMIPGANVSRMLARSGVDWVMVDCEHGNIDGEYGLYSFALPLFSFFVSNSSFRFGGRRFVYTA